MEDYVTILKYANSCLGPTLGPRVLGPSLGPTLGETERWLKILNQFQNLKERQKQSLVSKLVVPSLIDISRVASKRYVVLFYSLFFTTPIE